MRYFSAQFIFTGTGTPLRRGIVVTDDDGVILDVEDTGGKLPERHSVSFYNGIIVPGFVNCHCHLELSWLKDMVAPGTGLAGFISGLTAVRGSDMPDKDKALASADEKMAGEGVVLCADICNSVSTFGLKKKSRIRYISLLEVFGIDSTGAERRMNDIMAVAEEAVREGLEWYLVPHSAYSVSLPLFSYVKEKSINNKITSIHFMESEEENSLIEDRTGILMDAYNKFLTPSSVIKPPSSHTSAILEHVTLSGNLILVHNTAIRREQIDRLRKRENLFYCLCPGSNRFIENKVPPVYMLKEENCEIVIGTDSPSSNTTLSMLNEMRILQDEFPSLTIEELIRWATYNGSRALGDEKVTGSIEKGKKPGLVLIKDMDLENMKLLPGSRSQRLI